MSTPSERTSSDRDRLFERARSGDQDAWRELFETCYPKVVRAVRGQFTRVNGRVLRSLYDSTDIASDVWKSLAAKSDRFEFRSVDDLMHFLTHAAQQRVLDEYRRMTAQKRSEGRKVSLSGEEGTSLDPPSGGPTPSEIAHAREVSDTIEAGATESIRRLVRLKKDGQSNQEAAQELGWDLRKVQRVLKSVYDAQRRRLGLDR